MHRRCFWPPDTLVPPRGDHVVVAAGQLLDELVGLRELAGADDLFVGGLRVTQRMFSLIVPENRTFFCRTTETASRRALRS